MWALLQHQTPVCWGPYLLPTFRGRAVSETNPELSHVHHKDTQKVLEVSVIFMLSVCHDAFLSELLSHSHQVSGVWVAKTVRRNNKVITTSVWAQTATVPSSQGHQLIVFTCQELELHLSVFTQPCSQSTTPLRDVFETITRSNHSEILLKLKAYIPAWPAPYWGLVVNVIPGNDILHACSHGGTDGEDKALFEGPAQQAQHTIPLRAVREVGHAVSSWVANAWIWVFWLLASKEWKED